MGDKYGNYCAHCKNKNVPATDMPCAGEGFPSFWPHSYPNCFKVGEGVEIDIGGHITASPEFVKEFKEDATAIAAATVIGVIAIDSIEAMTPDEVLETMASDETVDEMDRIVEEGAEKGPAEDADEEEVAALEGDASVVDDLIGSVDLDEEPEDVDEEIYGEEPKEEAEKPIKAVADVDAKGLYYCTECEHNHTYKSKVGKEHLEFAGDPPQD